MEKEMINKIAAALVALGGGFALLFAPSASASDHYGPKVTVDLRQLPKGDCWYEVDRRQVEPLCAPKPVKGDGDCKLVHGSQYRGLCNEVRRQRAYGWTDETGEPQNWVVKGKTLVHEITHQGYSQAEMRDALIAAHESYAGYVTDVSFNVDRIAKVCGHHYGNGVVQEIKGSDGHFYTWKRVVCD